MRKQLMQTIKIPSGVEAKLDGNVFSVKGPEGSNKREFNFAKLDIEKKGDEILIGNKSATKNEKKRINTITAHMKNMIEGVQKKYEYKLKICFSHFPITVEMKGDEAKIKNFLGEKISRIAKMPKGIDVKVDRETITITSVDKELAGQAAANFETTTRIRNRDRRVFQDGIFITNKNGEEM